MHFGCGSGVAWSVPAPASPTAGCCHIVGSIPYLGSVWLIAGLWVPVVQLGTNDTANPWGIGDAGGFHGIRFL